MGQLIWSVQLKQNCSQKRPDSLRNGLVMLSPAGQPIVHAASGASIARSISVVCALYGHGRTKNSFGRLSVRRLASTLASMAPLHRRATTHQIDTVQKLCEARFSALITCEPRTTSVGLARIKQSNRARIVRER